MKVTYYLYEKVCEGCGWTNSLRSPARYQKDAKTPIVYVIHCPECGKRNELELKEEV